MFYSLKHSTRIHWNSVSFPKFQVLCLKESGNWSISRHGVHRSSELCFDVWSSFSELKTLKIAFCCFISQFFVSEREENLKYDLREYLSEFWICVQLGWIRRRFPKVSFMSFCLWGLYFIFLFILYVVVWWYRDSRISYSRESLMSLAEADFSKELPSGFDFSTLR